MNQGKLRLCLGVSMLPLFAAACVTQPEVTVSPEAEVCDDTVDPACGVNATVTIDNSIK